MSIEDIDGNVGEGDLNFNLESFKESSATLFIPSLEEYAKGRKEYIPTKAPVFYNPIMSFNRDIAVLTLRVYQRKVDCNLRICEPFAGCGVRGIRFVQEVQEVEHVVLNDRSLQAFQLIKLNVEKNRVLNEVTIKNMDGNLLLSKYARPKRRFDVIDLDPFGSPAPFVESAVRALKNGGIIALTATDMAPLCGVKPLACIKKYHGKPLRTEYCQELAVRLLINSLVYAASKHNFGVKILLCHSSNHYIRVYAQTLKGATKASDTIKKLGYIAHCFNCLNRQWTKGVSNFPKTKCDICGNQMAVAGPLWMNNLFNRNFCEEMLIESRRVELAEKNRVLKLLRIILGEVGASPTYFIIDKISEKLKVPGISKTMLIKKVVDQGYKATETHFNSRGIRSDAPIYVINNAIKELVEKKRCGEVDGL
jgi:tRNA (guanine26-N2/guanine27-N2)-dimethyltransferase